MSIAIRIGSLPVGDNDELKRTNEIKTSIPLLDAIDIQGKDITADALLTQKDFADYLVRIRHAHYHFTVKKNQPTFFDDISFFFYDRKEPVSESPLRNKRANTLKRLPTVSPVERRNKTTPSVF